MLIATKIWQSTYDAKYGNENDSPVSKYWCEALLQPALPKINFLKISLNSYKPCYCIISGCGCQYSTYGCCPDNATVARGPNNQGCGCQHTPHGCCPNQYTPAAGPGYQGCPCYTYQFGCCPDGVTRAVGPNLQGSNTLQF